MRLMIIQEEIQHGSNFGNFQQFFYDNFRLKGKFEIQIYQSQSYFRFI